MERSPTSEQAVRMGLYTTAGENYENADAKGVVDRVCEQVNLDRLFQIGAKKSQCVRDSFWEEIEPDKLVTLRIPPLTSIAG